jgi:hypothetical protein
MAVEHPALLTVSSIFTNNHVQVVNSITQHMVEPRPVAAAFVGGLPAAEDAKRLRRCVWGGRGRGYVLAAGCLLLQPLPCLTTSQALLYVDTTALSTARNIFARGR